MADTNNETVVEDAKAKAEARRRRILEAGQFRLDVVAGNMTADTEAETPTKSSGSNRLAQMRRRRFKSSKSAAATTSPAPSTNTTSTAEDTPKEDKADTDKKEEVVTVEKPTVVEEEKPKVVEEEKKAKGDDEDTRKYMGVAKMRRKRLAEQKAATSSTNNTKADSSTNTPVQSSLSCPPISLVSGHSKLAAWMQLLTIILLFFSGLDAGFSSRASRVQTSLFVPTWAGGIQHDTYVSTMADDDHVAFSKQKQPSILQQEDDVFVDAKDEDEFEGIGNHKPSGADTSGHKKEPNIDPLFQIDMDALVDGYTGIFGFLVRTAIYFHRWNLYFFYDIPKSIFWDMPRRWLSAPPILFVLALLIRLVGKHILSAQVPEIEAVLTKKYETSTDNSKILDTGTESVNASKIADAIDPGKMSSIASNFVKNWLQNNFPSLYFIITALRDVRQDMYVILCGVLFGMVLKNSDPNTLIIPLPTSTLNTDGEL